MRTLSNAIAVWLLCAYAQAQINLPNEVSPYEPIVSGCNCVTPEGAEVHIRWLISSEPNAQAEVIEVPNNQVHIWGSPGKHRLVATVVWLKFDEIEVVTPDGGTKTIRNLVQWNTETFQHAFTILGPSPRPTPGPDNRPPVAVASGNPSVSVGEVVRLDSSESSDPDGDALSYSWVLMPPTGSMSGLSQADAAQPTFTPDRPGLYRARLTVDDGRLSDSDTVEITAGAVVEDGPRHVIVIEETAERTPAQADVIVDMRQRLRSTEHTLWVYDKDTQSSWLPSYERKRQQEGQRLPCVFIIDKRTNEVLHLGDLPESADEFSQLIREHGG